MAEPIDLADAKRQLRVRGDSEDQTIRDAIVDARGWIENYTGLILTRREVIEALPCFTSDIRAWPIASIDSVSYIDHVLADAELQTFTPLIARRPARLAAASWPSTYSGSAITVTVTAGFATADEINAFSPKIMRAMRVLVVGFFNDREGGDVAKSAIEYAKDLCRSFRCMRV